jgi:hypothetical protein
VKPGKGDLVKGKNSARELSNAQQGGFLVPGREACVPSKGAENSPSKEAYFTTTSRVRIWRWFRILTRLWVLSPPLKMAAKGLLR